MSGGASRNLRAIRKLEELAGRPAPTDEAVWDSRAHEATGSSALEGLPSEIVRIRGNGENTRNRIETAIPAQPTAIPPRTPITPATDAAASAPIG